MMMLLLIATNTLARPGAVLDLRPAQFDNVHGLLGLNPADRAQNKKYRPIVPVTATLRPWLELPVGESDRYVTHRKKPIGSILHMWRLTREAAQLDERVTPYSIRHGMARELRKRRVPTEQITLSWVICRAVGMQRRRSMHHMNRTSSEMPFERSRK